MRIAVPVLMCCVLSGFVQAEDDSVRAKSFDGVAYVHAGDLAATLGFKLERLQNGQLLTFCREGQGGVCIPVRLSESNHRENAGHVYLSAQIVSSALHVRANIEGDFAQLESLPVPPSNDNDLPSYNAAWGKGRGFDVGDTLPDIPLVDMAGNEVRFSKFLGKKYILYCWASW